MARRTRLASDRALALHGHPRSMHPQQETFMSSVLTGPAIDTSPGWLDKERTIAARGFNRWLVPPCALAIHLCIGMAYGFSVFWLPLSKALATAGSGAPTCAKDMSFFAQL